MSEPVLLTHRQVLPEPPPLPARNRLPPLPERTRPSHRPPMPIPDVTSDFEQRFRFHEINRLPPPEPLSGTKKTYASENTRKTPNQRPPPPPPPPLPPRSR